MLDKAGSNSVYWHLLSQKRRERRAHDETGFYPIELSHFRPRLSSPKPMSMKKSEVAFTLELCQQTIGYLFNDIEILKVSLIHASVADNRRQSNERLEFLGDAILGMVICHELYVRFPEYLEGQLTKIKSMLVSRRTCARIADQLNLVRFLRVGKGMGAMRKLPLSCRAAALESIIGAIFEDGGYEPAREFIISNFAELLDQADADAHQENYKSMLQQHAQQFLGNTPSYEVLDEKGPDHSKCFEVAVAMGSQRFPSAWGTSKKEAEQTAAFLALKALSVIPEDATFSSTLILPNPLKQSL